MTLGTFHQIAYVVDDLDTAVQLWADELRIGPWSVWTLEPPVLEDMTYHGSPAAFGIRHALAWSGSVQFELIQPLFGPSVFRDQLDRSGPGANHLGMIVDDHPAAVADLVRRGFIPLQSARGFGESRDGAFAYFQPPGGVDTIVELISPPTTRFAPEYVYPRPEA